MARFHKPNPDVDRAIAMGIKGESPAKHVDGTIGNPFSYGTPCYWAWIGAYTSRRELTGA